MPYEQPTLEQLDRGQIADIESRLDGTDPRVRFSALGALARAQAGATHLMHGFIAWVARNAFPISAEGPELLAWAAPFDIRPQPPVRATGTLALAGEDGTAVPAGTVWRSGAEIDYRSLAEVAIAAGSAAVAIEAVEPGAAGNIADGAKLGLVAPIAGLVSEAIAKGAIASGADEEDIESVRARLLFRMAQPPRGGTASDYVLWARSGHPDVTRAWSRPLASGPGTVTVYFMTDAATDDGIPVDATVKAVKDYIAARRPATAAVTVAAPAPVALAVTIRNVVPDTAPVKAAIEAEIRDLILRESEPGGTILISHIREAISIAAGETDHVLVTPDADVKVAAGEISVAGDFAFTAV